LRGLWCWCSSHVSKYPKFSVLMLHIDILVPSVLTHQLLIYWQDSVGNLNLETLSQFAWSLTSKLTLHKIFM
jgi:hypothetical protein